MICPGCGNRLGAPVCSSEAVIWPCASCGGNWIPSFQFWRWLNDNRHRRSAGSVSFDPGATGSAGATCPECTTPLRSALAGRGLAHEVLHCVTCGGFWSAAGADLFSGKGDRMGAMFQTLYFRERNEARRKAARAEAEQAETNTRYIRISRRKEFYQVVPELAAFLRQFGRSFEFPAMPRTEAIPCGKRWLTIRSGRST